MRRTGAELHRRRHRPEHGDRPVPAQDPGAKVAHNVLSPNFSVRWVRGVGNGSVVVRGSVAWRLRLALR